MGVNNFKVNEEEVLINNISSNYSNGQSEGDKAKDFK